MNANKFELGETIYTFLPYENDLEKYLHKEPIDMIASAKIVEIAIKDTGISYCAELKCPETRVPFGFDFKGERFFVKESRCFKTWNDCYERLKKIQKFLKEIKREET